MGIAAWTWMIYLATHNNAAEAGEESVARMRQAELGDSMRVLVQQSTPVSSLRRIIGATPEMVADLGQLDSGHPNTVIDFVRWAKETAPAQRYALVLWSHGSGWEPSLMERLARKQPAPEPVELAELTQRGLEDEGRQVFFSTTMKALLDRPTRRERAIAFDDGSGHALDTVELGKVIERAARILGQPVDLLGMNACQMSNAEVAYQVCKDACVYVASEEDMPVQGWPYEDILTRLAAQPDTGAEALGRMVVERYCAYFRDSDLPWGQFGLPPGVTLAAIRLDRVGPLADAAASLAASLRHEIKGRLKAVWNAHRKAHRFKSGLYDLAGFCGGLATHHGVAPATVDAARAILNALQDPTFMLKHDHTSPAYDDVGGLTTYLMAPGPGGLLSTYYAQTQYAKVTGWGDFLAAYHGSVPK